MKYCSLLLLASILAPAQDFLSGMAARAVLGQKTFTDQAIPAPSTLPDLYQPGIGQWILGAAGGIAYANGMLFIADSNNIGATPNNNRVLIYYDINKVVPPASVSIPVPTGPNAILCPVCTGAYNSPYGAAGTVLGQANFDTTTGGTSATTFTTPTAVASDGKSMVVADTQNNRVLIWLSIPSPGSNAQPADVVLGAPDMKTVIYASGISAKSLLGPQGVWIQDGRLFVADTRNHRVLVWNSIPRTNQAPADYVLGQKDFTSTSEQFVNQNPVTADAKHLLNPVSVTSDGTRLFVSDLGYNRVLIWSTIPTTTQAAADIVLGQPDMTSSTANNSSKLCASTGTTTDSAGKTVTLYPPRCESTVQFPRYALSDGKRLFLADGGDDRVMIWNTLPTKNGQPADLVLGQPDLLADIISDNSSFFSPNLGRGAPNTTRTPTSLAWDGTNLLVATPYDRRVLVFTPGVGTIPPDGVNNAASLKVYAQGSITVAGTIQENDIVKISIANGSDTTAIGYYTFEYDFTVLATDTIASLLKQIVDTLNGHNNSGDNYVFARLGPASLNNIILTARQAGGVGNNTIITIVTANTDATKTATISVTGGNMSGGGSAETVSPGSIIEIDGNFLATQTAGATPARILADGTSPNGLPTSLGGAEVYVDGNRLPLFAVSPTRIIAQLPYKLSNTNASSLYVRTTRPDGSSYVSTAISVPIATENPGIFAYDGSEPRPAVAVHASSYATGTILIDGVTAIGDAATVVIEDRKYTYTAIKNDTNSQVRDGLINLINGNPEEKVIAVPAGSFTRIRLFSKIAGPAGEDLKISTSTAVSSTTPTGTTTVGLTLGSTSARLCCSNVQDAPVTELNPAVPGETIKIYATGLGAVKDLNGIQLQVKEGIPYSGTALNQPLDFLSSLVGGSTANVLYGGLKPGFIGIYEVVLELNSNLPTNPQTQMTIAQYVYTSNIVTIPVAAVGRRPGS